MKDVTEDFWRYACDIQQRVSGPFESDNFCVRGQDGVVIDLAAHPGNLNALCQVSRTRRNELTHANSRACVFFERQVVRRGREKSWRLAIDADRHGNSTRRLAFGFYPYEGAHWSAQRSRSSLIDDLRRNICHRCTRRLEVPLITESKLLQGDEESKPVSYARGPPGGKQLALKGRTTWPLNSTATLRTDRKAFPGTVSKPYSLHHTRNQAQCAYNFPPWCRTYVISETLAGGTHS